MTEYELAGSNSRCVELQFVDDMVGRWDDVREQFALFLVELLLVDFACLALSVLCFDVPLSCLDGLVCLALHTILAMATKEHVEVRWLK